MPLVFLRALALAGGGKRFWQTTAAIALLSGVLVWLFARAFVERSLSSMAIALAAVVIYGGLILGAAAARRPHLL